MTASDALDRALMRIMELEAECRRLSLDLMAAEARASGAQARLRGHHEAEHALHDDSHSHEPEDGIRRYS